MKKILFLIVLPYLAFSADRKKLFECNMYVADYQEVRVYQEEDSRLILYMLHNSGRMEERPLPKKQWEQQKIALPCKYSPGICGYVYKSGGRWVYKTGYDGGGFSSYGSCR